MAEVIIDSPNPTHHIRLTDGEEVIGLIFCNQDGTPNERAFTMAPYPRQALKTSQGESKYSDLEPPFFTKAQDDWTGGRAAEDFDKDSTKYYDAYRMDPTKDGLVLGGEETYGIGYRDVIMNMPDSMSWQVLHTTGGEEPYVRYMSTLVDDGPSTSLFTSAQCELWIRKVGTPGNLVISLYDPGNPTASYTIAPSALTDVTSVLYSFPWTGVTAVDESYWVVVDGGTGTTPDDHWEVGVVPGDGITAVTFGDWTTTTTDLAYRITDADADFIARFINYKGCLYYYTQPDAGGASTLYRNGWRGAADDNTGQLSYLIDATQTWTVDRLIGARVVITNGPGSEETQPWRIITDNDATTLTVSPAWNVVHTTSTEYVVLDTDWWTSVQSLTNYVTGATVAGDFIYFCRGELYPILRYQEYNKAGVWTVRSADEGIYGKEAVSVRHSEDGDTLWVAINEDATYDVCLARAQVPPKWGQLYTNLGTLVETNKPWDAQSVTNVTQSTYGGATRIDIAAGFTTGVAAVKNLPAPVDITAGKRIGFLIRSSVATSNTGDIKIVYDEDTNLGQSYAPSSVKQFERDKYWLPVVTQYDTGTDAFLTATPKIYDGDTATSDDLTITSDDYLYIICDARFNTISFNLGGTKNGQSSNASAEYYDGSAWVAVANFDDTTDSVAGKTLSGNGTMSFTTPTRWEQVTKNSITGYGIRLKFSSDLTAAVTFNEIKVELKEAFRTLDYTFDGDADTAETLTWTTEDYLYIISSHKFSKITLDIGATVNAVATSSLTGTLWNGGTWSSVTLTDGTSSGGVTLAQDGDITFTPIHDWAQITLDGVTGYAIRLAANKALTAEIIIKQFSLEFKSNQYLSIPALTANEWEWAVVNVTPLTYPPPNSAAIQSVGLYVETAFAAGATIDILGGLKILRAAAEYTRLPADARINSMEIYAGAVEEPVSNPWVFTENQIYEIQTQNDNIAVPLPLRELSALSGFDNGIAHTTNGVYLYFNLGNRIEKYYNRTLDDTGPDRDAGLPNGRKGTPAHMVSLPGRIAVALDANTGTSSVLYNTGTAWHEAYRAPRAGLRIRALGVQPIPGKSIARLWISQGSDVLWIPFSLNPFYDADYRYTHEGHLITGWHYAGMQDVFKLWAELKLFMENTDQDNQFITADFQLDGDTTWTEVGTFDAIPVEAQDIDAVLPRSRRIRFRLRFHTTDNTETPRLKAMTLEGVGFVPVKDQYAFTFILDPKGHDLAQNLEIRDVNAVIRTLKRWANDGHLLQVQDVHGLMSDDQRYFIDPPAFSPLRKVDTYGRQIGKVSIIQV